MSLSKDDLLRAAELIEWVGSEFFTQAHAPLASRLRSAAETHVLVPREPTQAQWGGLARDIMMWLDMERKTPRALFEHLDAIGTTAPAWLVAEPEMRNLDSVPSKGTRCVILYRAMLSAAQGESCE